MLKVMGNRLFSSEYSFVNCSGFNSASENIVAPDQMALLGSAGKRLRTCCVCKCCIVLCYATMLQKAF